MKHLLGYVIWNKAKMLDWLTDGIIESFMPNKTDLLFVLDNPIDGTDDKLTEILKTKLIHFKAHVIIKRGESFKFPCQNTMLEFFKANGFYRSLIAPQDDQKITDKNLVSNIESLIDKYGERLGLIGLRDGFYFGYQDMVSSEWSESEYGQQRLKPGEHAIRPLLNDGPLVYNMNLVANIGLHDTESYKRFYIEDDYCARASQYGLTNIVMGNSLIHDRTMSSIASSHYNDDAGEKDLQTFKERWKL